MKKVLIIFAVSGTLTTQAQYKRSGGGAMSIGMQTHDVAPFKQFYTDAPDLNSTMFTWGGYGYVQFGNFLVGISGAGSYGTEVEDATNKYYLGGGYFTSDWGWKIINKTKWALYPIGHFGGGGLTYNISSVNPIALGGGDAITLNNAEYTWGNIVYGASIRFEYYIGLKPDKNGGQGGGLLGLETGYLTSPKSNEWEAGVRTPITGGPDYAMNSFFIRLTIGGFGGI